jgi:hypothetical protein
MLFSNTARTAQKTKKMGDGGGHRQQDKLISLKIRGGTHKQMDRHRRIHRQTAR